MDSLIRLEETAWLQLNGNKPGIRPSPIPRKKFCQIKSRRYL
jgi:hypothetical protein